MDLRHSLIPDDLIEDLLHSMPKHKGPDLEVDRHLPKYDYVGFMERMAGAGGGDEAMDRGGGGGVGRVTLNGGGGAAAASASATSPRKENRRPVDGVVV